MDPREPGLMGGWGKWEVGHHCKQGRGAENEVDCAEQMAAGETPAFLIQGLNKETFVQNVPWHWVAGSIYFCIGLERGELPGEEGDARGDRVEADDDPEGGGGGPLAEHGTAVVDHEGDAEDAEDDEDKVDAAEIALQDALALLSVIARLCVHLLPKCGLLEVMGQFLALM